MGSFFDDNNKKTSNYKNTNVNQNYYNRSSTYTYQQSKTKENNITDKVSSLRTYEKTPQINKSINNSNNILSNKIPNYISNKVNIKNNNTTEKVSKDNGLSIISKSKNNNLNDANFSGISNNITSSCGNKNVKSNNIINNTNKNNTIINNNVKSNISINNTLHNNIINNISIAQNKTNNNNKIIQPNKLNFNYNQGHKYNYEDEDKNEGDYEENYEEDDYEEDDDDYYYEEDYNNNYTFNQNDYNYIDYNDSIENKFTFYNNNNFTEEVDNTIDPNPITEIHENIVNVLMIAEKPSIARTISKILCGNNKLNDLSKEKGWCYFSFQGKFKGKLANFVVSSVSGHIYQTEFLNKHRKNKSIENLFNVPLVKIECNDDSFLMTNWLKNLAENKDILCLWLDCDREGENICYEVIYNVLPYMNKKEYQQIYRAIFSSLAKIDIINSFDNIINYPDNNLSLSVDARQVIDLKIGVSLTRFLTNNILPNLPEYIESRILSYGPCQTPTLWFCVNREKEMEKENLIYYKIYIKLSLNDDSVVKIWLDKEYKDLDEVKKIIKKFQKYGYIKINNIIKEKRTKKHPLGLNTVNMLKNASNYLGYSPQKTMNIAQKLYMRGYITYPRTETNVYSSSFDFKSYLSKYSKKIEIQDLINNLNDIDLSPEGGIDAGDHPPITPSRIPSNKVLNEEELDLYYLIRDYYFASLSPDLEYENIIYEFDLENKKYNSTCSVIKNKGYTKFLDFHQKDFIEKNEILKEKKYNIIKISYEKKEKDGYITEAELIEEMEKNKIGTDASMSVHIENIVKRGYVEVDENRRLIPTKLGRALIEALEEVQPDLVLPKNRAVIESFVSELANGKKSYEEVLDYALNFYEEKYINISERIDDLLEVFLNFYDFEEEEEDDEYHY